MNSQRKIKKRLGLGKTAILLCLLTVTTLGASPARHPEANMPQTSSFQVPVTSTVVPLNDEPSQVQITFLELGYAERDLVSPFSNVEYTFRLPESWRLSEGGFLDLDLSYAYAQIESMPSYFGELTVIVDGQTQLVFSMKEPEFEHTHLRVSLPPDSPDAPTRNQHTVELQLDAGHLCDVPHKAHLVVHSTSFFSLVYDEFPLTIDLANYPRPFYQRSFEPDVVQFVLATEPTPVELSGALAIAARLGDLTDNRLVISGTTDMEWLNRLEFADPPSEHLFVIGRPDTNRLLASLNELGVLPVSFRQREMELVSQGPVAVAPGGLFAYTLTVTNTTRQAASSLTLVDRLPWQAQLVGCRPSCATAARESDIVRWSLESLTPQESAHFTLILSATDVLTTSMMENVTTLVDEEKGPLNTDTLTTTLDPNPTQIGSKSSATDKNDHFFVWNGQAVAEGDGIVQEIISPWHLNRAILVITGLDDQAVYKASQAMSVESRFPGMKGPLTLVSEVRSVPESTSKVQATDLTFADLGYEDKVRGESSQTATYYFAIPLGWRLTEAAYLDLRFNHSQFIQYSSSSLSVLFNDKPITTIGLNEETALDGRLRVELPPSLARPGHNNKIDIQTALEPLGKCTSVKTWILTSNQSLLHLDHSVQEDQVQDLDLYPTPFDQRSDLSDVQFVLPSKPRPEEWESALRLVAALGDAAHGSQYLPAVNLGSDIESDSHHLIAIGRPSRNMLLQQLNDQLPQPFLPGTDQINQELNDVVFRLPPGVSLGYVQLMLSPWNETRSLLVVTGTSDEGVAWATRSLVDGDLLGRLAGNLALVRDREIQAMDTRTLTRSGIESIMSTAVPELTPVVSVTPTATLAEPTETTVAPAPQPSVSQSSSQNRPEWLVPLIAATALIVVIIFVIALWQAFRQRETDELTGYR